MVISAHSVIQPADMVSLPFSGDNHNMACSPPKRSSERESPAETCVPHIVEGFVHEFYHTCSAVLAGETALHF
jgi:hypothetical protein